MRKRVTDDKLGGGATIRKIGIAYRLVSIILVVTLLLPLGITNVAYASDTNDINVTNDESNEHAISNNINQLDKGDKIEEVELNNNDVKLFDLDFNNLDIEVLKNTLNSATMNEIGEWLVSLPENKLNEIVELDTILKSETTMLQGELDIEDEDYKMPYWQACVQTYYTSLIMPLTWVDDFRGGNVGNARFFIRVDCDEKLVTEYMVDCPNVVQANDGEIISMGLSFITPNFVTNCSEGHRIPISFSSMYKVTLSKDYWSGFRIFGSVKRPAGYLVTDKGVIRGPEYTKGFGAVGYSRFGTDSYGNLDFSNKWLLDARFYDHEITDEFCLEVNSYHTGLMDGAPITGQGVNNFGRAYYYIEYKQPFKKYIINPNGGYYEGSKESKEIQFKNPNLAADINVPTWSSDTEGKTFLGWELSDVAVLVNNDQTESQINGGKVYTKDRIKIKGLGGEDGKYIDKSRSSSVYGSYIYHKSTFDTELKALWQVDWIKVNFDGNRPTTIISPSDQVQDIDPTNKQVWVNKAYGDLPTPSLRGHKFLGWYDRQVGGNQITASTICTRDYTHTLYAHWERVGFHLDFDTNNPAGMEGVTASGMTGYTNGKDVEVGKPYGTLPTPSFGSKFVFLGWYTHPQYGQKKVSTDIYNTYANTTLYAHWDEQLYLQTTPHLEYSPYTINGTTFNKGGAYLDWTTYIPTTGYFHAYRKLHGGSTWSQITPGAPKEQGTVKIRTKYFTDPGANDLAKPNGIDEDTVESEKIPDNTKVSFDKPTDNGTTYDFYVKETTYHALGHIKTYEFAYGYRSWQAPVEGKYGLIAYGAGSPSVRREDGSVVPARSGATTHGSYDMEAGDNLYIVTGGKPSGSSGGYNGGGNGGTNGRPGSGGGGATHIATRIAGSGLLADYGSYKNSVILVSSGAGGTGGNGDDGSSSTHGKASGGAGGEVLSNGTGSSGSSGQSKTGGNYQRLCGGGGGGARLNSAGSGGSGGGAHGIDDGRDDNYRAGSGGGGGAGWYGGGGGGGASQADLGIHYGSVGQSGGFGYGGNGGNSPYSGSHTGYHSGAGGGGGAGSCHLGSGLTNAEYKTGENYNANGRVIINLEADYSDETLKESNIKVETITTGVKGYRYIINTSSSTTVAYNAGTFVTTDYVNVPNKSYGQYVHIAPQDGAGNIGATIHVYIEPTFKITYNLDGGTYPPGETNPDGYTPTTPDITLVNPEQEDYEFIGWTGTGIDPNDPQMEVVIPEGSTGDKTFTANWAQKKPYVSEFTLDGDVYKFKDKEYFINAENVFDLKWYSYIKNKAGNIISSKIYMPTDDIIQIKNKDLKHIQTRDHFMEIGQFEEYSSLWTFSDVPLLRVNDYSVVDRSTQPYGNIQGFKYLNTVIKARLMNHLDKVTVYPQAGVKYKDKTYLSEDFDETKKLTITADGKAPVIEDNIIDDGVYSSGNLPIKVNIKDEDTGESGIKELKIELLNIDTGYTEVIGDIINNSYKTETSFEYINSKGTLGLIIDDNENYVGEIKITITATDNVNNVSTVEKTVFVISLEAEIKRMLPTVDKDGNMIPDSVFKDEEQGEIIIRTTGFIDQLDIEFDGYMQHLGSEQELEIGSPVIIPLPNNGDSKNTNTRTTPNTDPDTLKPRRADEYFFFVPAGTWIAEPDDPEDNVHYIIIRVHKKHKVLDNVLSIGTAGDDYTTDDKLEIDGRIETEVRTRIRERD